MNFEYSEVQQQLADSIGKYLANEYSFEKRKTILTSPSGLSDTAWTTFAELGLTSIALPEADGGFGGGALDLMAAMEACGEALVVEPLLDNIVGGRLVSRAGSAAQREAMLPGLMAGSLKLAFSGLEPGGRYALTPSNTHARAAGDGWVLDGEKCVVFGVSSADTLIVSALAGPAGGVDDRLVEAVPAVEQVFSDAGHPRQRIVAASEPRRDPGDRARVAPVARSLDDLERLRHGGR